MKLLSFFRRKLKIPSPDASCDTSHRPDDMSSYISDISKEVNENEEIARIKSVKEDPLITISRQLTQIQYQIGEVKPAIDAGVQSLREDHYRILEEQVKGVEEYKRYSDAKRKELLSAKENAEQELQNLEVDGKILGLLENCSKRALEIADELKISRQYASDRLKALLDLNQVSSIKEGRNVYYTKQK